MARLQLTERIEQRILVHWLTMHGVTFAHVPNFHSGIRKKGGQPNWAALRARQLDGVQDGHPDLLIYSRPKRGWSRAAFEMMMEWRSAGVGTPPHGIAIELKSVNGKKPTEKQQWWLNQFQSMGWIATWCRGADAAINFLKVVGYGN